MARVLCTTCGNPYPDDGAPYCCALCGGLYDFAEFPTFDRSQVDPRQPGLWRYCHALGLPSHTPLVSLGEGNTPLVWAELCGFKVALKCEFLNPSGSFKDRGSAVLAGFLLSRDVSEAVEDSSGNAGASFAAYAARAGIRARIFVPESASGPKRLQIERYGAELVRVPGPRPKASEAVRRVADQGVAATQRVAYASHAYMPFNLPGYATAAYEIVEQLGQAPGTVIVPAGQGGLLLGMARGFDALKATGEIAEVPCLVGVQARACAPLWALSLFGEEGLNLVTDTSTAAEGICVRHPLRREAILQAVQKSGGIFIAVEEDKILPARDHLAHLGFYVETTSAVIIPALAQLAGQAREPIVAVLTGSGLKTSG